MSLELLTDPLAYAFVQRALLALTVVGIVSGVVGCYVVVRGLAFFGDALAHTVLPGVALAYTLGGGQLGTNLFVGGLTAGILSAWGIAALTRHERLKEDTAVALVFVTMFALGIAVISQQGSYATDLTHILFGSVLGISRTDLILMAGLGGGILATIAVLYKPLMIISFDLTLAYTLKLPVETLRLLLLVLIAITIVTSLQAVGIALMLALLIAPAATARLLVNRLHHMMLVAAGVGVLGSITGFYLSYYLDVPSGAAIVLTMSSIFAVVLSAKSLRERVAV
jgi:manganese/iron transport system permease protein